VARLAGLRVVSFLDCHWRDGGDVRHAPAQEAHARASGTLAPTMRLVLDGATTSIAALPRDESLLT
jgi:hypothetical protein